VGSLTPERPSVVRRFGDACSLELCALWSPRGLLGGMARGSTAHMARSVKEVKRGPAGRRLTSQSSQKRFAELGNLIPIIPCTSQHQRKTFGPIWRDTFGARDSGGGGKCSRDVSGYFPPHPLAAALADFLLVHDESTPAAVMVCRQDCAQTVKTWGR
jgi:hypothetical protein